MKNRNQKHSDDWETPKAFYDFLDSEFHFDFDPCPLKAKFDGLALKKWGKRAYVNPPYSRQLKEAFVRKAVEVAEGGASLVVCLLPVSTSTKLFHEVILEKATDIRFVKGRLKFKGVNTKGVKVSKNTGMHDSMVLVFDYRPECEAYFYKDRPKQ